jgi:4-amino-4-deoxy-L-arabinose transferase-like glycosyltransferase
MQRIEHSRYAIPLIAIIAGIVFIPFIGNSPLFDWDEVNFAECAREMIVSGDYSHVQLNYRPFWEKPPFFIWLQAISMNLFGVNEFAARLPNAACSIFTFIAIYLAGRRFHSGGFGLLWCLLYAATLLPHLYFKSGLIDPWFNLFIFLSIYHSIFIINNPAGKREMLNGLAAGIFLGLAVLTKGPAALVISGLTLAVTAVWSRQHAFLRSWSFAIFALTTVTVSSSWFIVEWLKGNGDIIREFIDYQRRLLETGDAGHDGPWYYHVIVLLLGCFPVSLIFIISYLKYLELTPFQRLSRKVLLALFWVVLILFSIVKTKIVHYSSLCYFPMTFVAAAGLTQFFQSTRWYSWTKILYWAITAVIALAYAAITLIEHYKLPLIEAGWINDEFAIQNLMSDVSWSGFEVLPVFLFIAAALLIYHGIGAKKLRLVYTGIVLQLAFVWLAIALIIPKVEMYTQHAAITFYKSCARHHCYVETHGFKSYAYLFYSERKPSDYVNEDQKAYIAMQLEQMVSEGHSRLTSFSTANLLWMEHGKIDRPAYIVVKTPAEKELLDHPEMSKLYERNGYSFFVRMPRGH